MSCLLTWNEFVDTAASEPVRRYCGATSEDDRRQIAAETDLKLNLGDLLYIGRRKELKLAATLMALDSQLAEEHKHPVNGPRKLKKKADLRLTQLVSVSECVVVVSVLSLSECECECAYESE
jgi:hypothetical protein